MAAACLEDAHGLADDGESQHPSEPVDGQCNGFGGVAVGSLTSTCTMRPLFSARRMLNWNSPSTRVAHRKVEHLIL